MGVDKPNGRHRIGKKFMYQDFSLDAKLGIEHQIFRFAEGFVQLSFGKWSKRFIEKLVSTHGY